MDATLNWLAEQIPKIRKPGGKSPVWLAMEKYDGCNWECGYKMDYDYNGGDWEMVANGTTPGSAIYQLRDKVKEFLKDN